MRAHGVTVVQHFAFRGSSHRLRGAARYVIDKVWLCRSPIMVGRKGYFNYSTYFYLPLRRLEEGEGEGVHPPASNKAIYTATKIPFIYSFYGNCAASVPISTCMHVSVSDLYTVFPGSAHIFGCSKIDRSILELYKSLAHIYECRNWERENIIILFWK